MLSLTQWLADDPLHANYLEGYYSTDCWALPPDSLIQLVWDGVQEPEYLTSSQGMLMLLVPGHLLRTTGLTDLRQGGWASAASGVSSAKWTQRREPCATWVSASITLHSAMLTGGIY